MATLKREDLTEEQAQRIIVSRDTNSFMELLDRDFVNPKRRLDIYAELLIENQFKSETDPTRHSALFLLNRNFYFGASDGGSLEKLALSYLDLDPEVMRAFDFGPSNHIQMIGEKLGYLDPIVQTPVMAQGHWIEQLVKQRLASERGYQFDEELLRKVNSSVNPDWPHLKATNDGIANKFNSEIERNQIRSTEIKAPADANHDFSKPSDRDVAQIHLQNLAAKTSGVNIDSNEIHYYNFQKGTIKTFTIDFDEKHEQLLKGGYNLALEHLEAGKMPDRRTVSVPVKDLDISAQVTVKENMELVETIGRLEKELEKIKKSSMGELKAVIEEHRIPAADVTASNFCEGTTRPASTMIMSQTERTDYKKVVELAKQHKVYDKNLMPSSSMSAAHLALLASVEEQGIDTSDYIERELDVERAKDDLRELGVDDSAMTTTMFKAYSTVVKSEKKAESKAYSDQLLAVTNECAITALKQALESKPQIAVIAAVEAQRQQTDDDEQAKDVAPTINDMKNSPDNGPTNM